MTEQQTRVAIVTGGSRGIGRAASLALATQGQRVAVNYANDQRSADETVAKIIAAGGDAFATQADVGDEKAVEAVFDEVEERFGGVDVVVNSAGRFYQSSVADLDLDELDSLHRTNIRGTFVVNQQAARRVRNGGAIINVTSSAIRLAIPTYAAYAASKAAIEGLVLILARELRGRNVTVNAVAPGPTATDMFLNGKSLQTIEALAMQSPLGRLGQPEDIAETIAFLAGPAGRWVNGQIVGANGGIV